MSFDIVGNEKYIESLLRIVEEELGERWLRKKVDQGRKRQKWGANPIPRGWFRLNKRLLEKPDESRVPVVGEELKVIKVAKDLAKIRDLSNYSKGIPRGKLKDSEFEKYAYLASVAALATEYAYTVSFVLEGEKKTPDLHLADSDFEFYVECKKKDPYLPKQRDGERWKLIQDEIINYLEEVNENYSVVVIVMGEMHKNLETEVHAFLKEHIPNNAEGLYTNNKYGFSIAIHKLEDSYEEYSVALPTTPGGTYGAAIGKVAVDKEGRQYLEKRKRVQLYVVDAHDMAGISSSFIHARSQIPRESLGVIFVDIDISCVNRNDLKDYLNALNISIRNILAGSDNRRLAAVVISTEVEIGNYIYMIIRNEKSEFPANKLIPGEDFSSLTG